MPTAIMWSGTGTTSGRLPPRDADGWWLMLHFAGGHFATDENGRLIEWDGSPYMESSFYGLNQIRTDCNARVGRTLDNRDFGYGDSCNEMLVGALADDHFLDANGVAWVDENGPADRGSRRDGL